MGTYDPNTLTGLIPTIYTAMDKVAREQVGFIPAVYKNTSVERAAKDETIRYPVVPAVAGGNISPAGLPADDGAAVIGYSDMTISKSRYFPVRINGEETKGLGNAPGMYEKLMADRFAQAIRAAVNEIETDLAGLYIYASRAVKTTGLRLFDSTDKLASLAQLRRILMDNGAQGQELQLVLGSSASALLRSADFLFKVNEAGTDDMLRRGVIAQLGGFGIHESAQIASHTNGTYANAVCTDLALGGTALTTTGAVAASILAGDLLKIANDDNNVYVSQLVGISAGTSLTINAPGSLVAHAGATDAITPLIATSYYPNMAFAKDAIHLVTRAPAMPAGGDMATDATMITDPISGLTFEVREYKQYHQVKYELCIAWGVKAAKSDFIALLAE